MSKIVNDGKKRFDWESISTIVLIAFVSAALVNISMNDAHISKKNLSMLKKTENWAMKSKTTSFEAFDKKSDNFSIFNYE